MGGEIIKPGMIQVSAKELAKVENNVLNKDQLNVLFQGTPEAHKYKRPAKGGGEWTYVTGAYVKKVLNLMFGWDWDFEVTKFEYNMGAKQCIVLGKLTVRSGGKTIIKNQFGRVDIKFKTNWDNNLKKKIPTDQPLDLGNDLKAATTDSLKKCASELGIASDVYAPNEFKAIQVVEPLTQEEIDEEKLRLRIVKHINNAKNLTNLSQASDELGEDQELWGLYNKKYDELKSKENVK